MRAVWTMTVLAVAQAAAGQENVERLTLAQATERALAASPTVGRLRAGERAAEADARAAAAGRLPQVELQAGYARQSDVPEIVVGGQTIFPNLPDNYRTRLAATVPLFTGGRLERALDSARLERTASAGDLDAGRRDLVYETTAAYWSLATARRSEEVLREALSAYDAHLKDAQNRADVGLAARNEVLAVQVERDRAELSLLRASESVAVAEADLLRLLDLPAGTRVETAEALDGAAAQADDGLAEGAIAARPERAAALARAEAAEARIRGERGARLPQVALAAGVDYANPNRKILPPSAEWDHTWDVGVSLTWNVFDGGRTNAAVARAEARAAAAREQLADVDRRIRLEVTRAQLGRRTAGARVALSDRSLESARENRRVAADRYRAGVIPSSELLDAEVALLRAGLDRTDAQASLRLSDAALVRATGR
ncbi:MAG: TolC family protein [Vicinamibacteria bacterium]